VVVRAGQTASKAFLRKEFVIHVYGERKLLAPETPIHLKEKTVMPSIIYNISR